jgi:hypothetical protein
MEEGRVSYHSSVRTVYDRIKKDSIAGHIEIKRKKLGI